MRKNAIEEAIKNLEEKINNLEADDPYHIDERLQYLRNAVFFVHARIETGLETLIIAYLTSHLEQKDQRVDPIILKKAQPILNELTFAKKAEFCKNWNIISDDVLRKVNRINKLRNRFSHPSQGTDSLAEFSSKKNYSAILELLLMVLDKVNELYVAAIANIRTYSSISNVKVSRRKGRDTTIEWDQN
jgi:hypothetical protein